MHPAPIKLHSETELPADAAFNGQLKSGERIFQDLEGLIYAVQPSPPIVTHGRGYQGLAAYKVSDAVDEHRFIPGRTVLVVPEGEEAPGWRAILAGFDPNGDAIVVPLQGHYGELRARRLLSFGKRHAGLCLSRDEPMAASTWSTGDECDWTDAKALALSIAMTFNLESRV